MTTSAPSTSSPRRPTAGWLAHGNGLTWRLRLTLVAVADVLLAVPALVLLCTITTSLGVAVVGVGLLLLLVLVPLNAALAQVQRRLSGSVLGRTIERPDYLRAPSASPLSALATWVRDPARWRDYAWTWTTVVIGWAMSWLALGLGLAVVWYAIFPFLFAVTPEGVLVNDYGFLTVDTQEESFLQWIVLVIAFALWWWLLPPLVRLRALLDKALLSPSRHQLERRVAEVAASRTETIDHSAAELRRIERDLHDGAQARLVSLGMSLGMAEELVRSDPDAAARLIAEARDTTVTTLGDLRSVVRGIHPPVLADRGLAGAVQALALDLAVPTTVLVDLPGRAPEPVESAIYFAVAEALANVVKHADARRATVTLGHDGRVLRAVVTDDGRGGADPGRGTGLAGVARRLAAFDGTLTVTSPSGGPTTVTLELPCALSSPRTTPSSGTA